MTLTALALLQGDIDMVRVTQECVGVHPRVRPGLEALAAYLYTEGYTMTARGRILDHVSREGTLEGLVAEGWLEPANEATAEEVYVDALPAIAGPDPSWHDDGIYLDVDSIVEAFAADGIELVDEDGMDFPRKHTAADRAAFQAEIAQWYRTHPEG
jgi:hypothetical protein